jgi:hypothetical protein
MTEAAAETPLLRRVTGAGHAEGLVRLLDERASAAAAIIDRVMPAREAAS